MIKASSVKLKAFLFHVKLNGLRGLPFKQVQELLIEAITKDGNYKIIKDENGTTFIRKDSCTTKEQ